MSLELQYDQRSEVTVAADGVELLRYVVEPDTVQLESPKPYLHPLRTREGRLVSLFRPHDHVWHKGIAWALPHVGDENFWGGPTFSLETGYQQLENNGTARHVGFETLGSDGELAEIAHDLLWTTQAGERVIEERRRLRIRLVDGGWALTVATSMTNVAGHPLAFGSPTTKGRENAGYGGLFWRGPRSFTGGVVRSPDGDGGEELRGTRHPWLGFTGRHDGDGASSTLVIVDDERNVQHPPQWFARTEEFACLCPAPFFSEEHELPAGETLALRYAVVIADGDAPGDAATALAEAGREALELDRS
ncbi:MAG: PmoA family protein [Microbacteriaceae bacterium]